MLSFDEIKIDRFITAWFHELQRLGTVKGEATETLARGLQTAVRRPDLWRLAPNPLLLTVMALVHTHKGQLPDARALLYEETVDILLWRWEQIKLGGEEQPGLRQLMSEAKLSDVDLKRALWRLAFEAHRAGGGKESPADINEQALQDALVELHPARNHEWAFQVIQAIKLRAGLLLERAAHLFTFPHRTFQEYLAGAHLANLPDFPSQSAKLAAEGAFWREAILLAVGRLVYLSGNLPQPLALVAELCPAKPFGTNWGWRHAWLAGEVLLEAGLQRAQSSHLGAELFERTRQRLADLLTAEALAPVERAAAGVVLGKLGDPRRGVGVDEKGWPDIDWIEIPPGPFIMGFKEGEAKFNYEKPQFTCGLIKNPYRISRYLITVAQYDVFVKAGGYGEARYWPEAKAANLWSEGKVKGWTDDNWCQQPANSGEAFAVANHPVVGVSWYEAVAYGHWLSEQLGFPVALPSEAEWERAARHTDGRMFPWGREEEAPQRCNMWETGIGHTSAVGLFPSGNAVCGAADMTGNVWEWCRTKWLEDYQSYEKKVDDNLGGEAARVLRGGSWDDDRDDVRCAYRLRGDPSVRSSHLGFRVVASPFVSGR